MAEEPLERSESFPTGGQARLKLSNIRGRVDLRAGEPGVITVNAVKRDPELAAGTFVDISQAPDGTVIVETRFPGRHAWLALGGRRRPSRVDYTVRVPAACDVELGLVEADAFVAGLTGDLDLHTVSGDLRLADLAGRLSLHTVSGDVYGERLAVEGELDLSAVSGSVTLLEARLPAVSASTVSGDLNLQTPLGAGPYDFRSVSGDLRLSVPADTSCGLSLHSLSGRIHSNVAFTRGRRAAEAEGPDVHLHSVSGDLWLVTPDAPPAPPAPRGPQDTPSRRDVLDRIARGELTVEAAMEALKAQ